MPEPEVSTLVAAKDTRTDLKKRVLPILRDAGFTDGTPSRLWRHHDGRIECIRLSTFSTYRAATDRCTTASFTVELGISLKEYSALHSHFHRDNIKSGPNGPRPDPWHMPIRGNLCPSDAHPLRKGRWGWEYAPIWRVETLDDAETQAADLAQQLQAYALAWLTQPWDLEEIGALLQSHEEDPLLVKADNGSHLRLSASTRQSHERADHLMMLRRGSGKGRLPG